MFGGGVGGGGVGFGAGGGVFETLGLWGLAGVGRHSQKRCAQHPKP